MEQHLIAIRNEMIESCASGNISQFIELYDKYPELHSARPWLYNAASDGKVEAVRHLISLGRDPNERSNSSVKMTALKIACAIGNSAIVEILLSSGASLEASSIDDNALFSAVYSRNIDCVKLLIEAGIDIHKTYDLGHRFKNALAFADEEGCKDIAAYLREHGAVLPPQK